MKRMRAGTDVIRVINLINYCNSQVTNVNDQAIIRALFSHASDESEAGPITSLEQIAREANISPASVSRFIRKAGYTSFEDFRTSFSRDLEQVYHRRAYDHARTYGKGTTDVFDTIYQRTLDNLRATNESLDREQLRNIVRILDKAHSVTIYGDEHTLADLYTLQLDLMARGVAAFLFKNEVIQELHAQNLGDGDVVLFATAAQEFVRSEQMAILRELHTRNGVTLIGFSQDDEPEFRALFDHFVLYGLPGSLNDGFHSLWYLSLLMSELLYDL